MLRDLDVAARRSGIPIWEDPGWRNRGHGAMARPSGIIIHHTAGGGSNDWKIVRDGRAGLAGPLSQFTLERDGSARLLACGQCWHAGNGSYSGIGTNNGNQKLLGIEGVSNGSTWTDAQRVNYPKLAAGLCVHYGIDPKYVIGHKEWTSRKIDPGNWNMNDFRNAVRQHIARINGGTANPPTTPVVKKKSKLILLGA